MWPFWIGESGDGSSSLHGTGVGRGRGGLWRRFVGVVEVGSDERTDYERAGEGDDDDHPE